MMKKASLGLLLLLAGCLLPLLAGCSCNPEVASTEFIASERDFADFDTWERFDRGTRGFLPSHLDGETYVYLNRRPEEGATAFPVGTIVVRVTSAGPMSDWEVHAMVKRGGQYNAAGAVGWEYFDLEMVRTAGEEGGALTPTIHWRGEGPGDDGDGYARGAEGVLLGCNHCHAAVVERDGMLGDEFDLPMP